VRVFKYRETIKEREERAKVLMSVPHQKGEELRIGPGAMYMHCRRSKLESGSLNSLPVLMRFYERKWCFKQIMVEGMKM
jgi:hypothetical protein